jgi:putative peptidoglycan lipid II flippase
LLFMGGEFSYEKAVNCSFALFYYSLGLSLVALVRVLVPAFYSMQDTRTPVKAAFMAFIFNFLFSLALMGPLKHGGLALASTLSALCQMVILLYLLRKKIGRFGGRKIFVTVSKTALASLPMAAVVYWTIGLVEWSMSGQKLIKGAVLGGGIAGGIAVFLITAFLLKLDEVNDILKILRRRMA